MIKKLTLAVVNKMDLSWEDQQDYFQTGYLAGMEAERKLDRGFNVPIGAWVFLNVKWKLWNLSTKERTRRRIIGEVPEIFDVEGGVNLVQQTVDRDLATRVLNSKILSDRERFILYKIHVEGWEGREVAMELGVAASGVNRAARVAKEKLKRRWGSRV